MSSCDLEIALDRPDRTYRAGEVVRGVVGVTVNKACRCDELVVKVEWHTHGSGSPDTGTASEMVLFAGEWGAGEKNLHPFELAVGKGPLTWHGHHLNVDWRVHATASIPWGFDPEAEVEVIVVDDPSLPELDHGPAVHRGAETSISGAIQVGTGVVLLVAGLGMVPTFGFGAAMTWAAGESFLTAVMVGAGLLMASIFGGIGVALARGAVLTHLARQRMGAPRVLITPEVLTGGQPFDIQIAFTPTQSLEVRDAWAMFRGRERVMSGSGTNRKTYTHEIHESRIALSHPRVLPPGIEARIEGHGLVPDGAPPSFGSDDNHLEWMLELHVELGRGLSWTPTWHVLVRP